MECLIRGPLVLRGGRHSVLQSHRDTENAAVLYKHDATKMRGTNVEPPERSVGAIFYDLDGILGWIAARQRDAP